MYVVIELQTNESGAVGNFVYAYSDKNEAEAKYHKMMASAALSKLLVDAVILMDNSGNVIMNGVYYHDEKPVEQE